MDIKKCAIIGCGLVGTSIAFTLMKSGIFSEIILIDTNQSKAEGEAMDLNHCNPFIKPVEIHAGSYCDIKDCILVIITAGTGQKPNQTRLELVRENVNIFKSIIPQITKQNKDCILLVVSNPVDILTYVSLKLSGFAPNKVIGSGTVLDTARLKYLLSEHLHVDSRNVHAFMVGEHGDSELPIWSSANISGINIEDFCNSSQTCCGISTMNDICLDVKNSAYEIIKRKGSTYYGIALAVLRIVEAIVRNEHSILTVSSLVNNHYGLNNLCIGLPSIVGAEGVKNIIDIPLNESELNNLKNSANLLREIIDQIGL
ncbi:MAG: L-lactate dehydrogenase [Oscillospiraceae bacterium]